MKNITVSVPDDVLRRARIRAAEQGRSVSALVAEFLQSLGDLEALQRKVHSEITAFSGGDRLDRETLYDRALR